MISYYVYVMNTTLTAYSISKRKNHGNNNLETKETRIDFKE